MMKNPLEQLGLPYYVEHGIVGALIALAVYVALSPIADRTSSLLAGAMAGAFFYIGREVRDYEKGGGKWDTKGLVGGVAGPLLLYLAMSGAVDLPGVSQVGEAVQTAANEARKVVPKVMDI